MPEALHALSIARAGRLLRRRELTAVALTSALLERIAHRDRTLNAYITVDADAALVAAAAADRDLRSGRDCGLLHGIPICLKDNIDVAGLRTTAASRILAGNHAAADAPAVARLRAAGAIVLGKNNLAEFAHGPIHPDYGPTQNPWSSEHSPGGSSSGTAAAIAAGMALGGLGTDTGGSIRLPAAWCGLVGLKPTAGAIPTGGVVPLSPSLDAVGPMARTAADAAALFAVAAGQPDFQLSDTVKGLRFSMLAVHLDTCAPAIRGVLADAGKVLVEGGAIACEPVGRPAIPALDSADPAFMAICLPEATAYHLPWLRTRPEDYAPMTRAYLELGALYPATVTVQAHRVVDRLRTELDRVLERVDLLLAPVARGPAPRLDGPPMTMEEDLGGVPSRFTAPFNLSGHPAVSVPCGLTPEGLPLAIQIIGRRHAEATLLAAAHAVQAALTP